MLRGNEGKGLSSVLELHRVALLGAEINQHLTRDEFPSCNFSESPTAVRAEGAGREFGEGFGVGGGDLASFDIGIQVFAHELTTLKKRDLQEKKKQATG